MQNLLLIFLFPLLLQSATQYYVSSLRESNGTGSEASPWKMPANIDSATIAAALVSDSVIINFSSRDTFTAANRYDIKYFGSTGKWLILHGKNKYNTAATGTASWSTESDTGRRALFTGDLNFAVLGDPASRGFITFYGLHFKNMTWGPLTLNLASQTTNLHDLRVSRCVIDSVGGGQVGVTLDYCTSGCYNFRIDSNTIMKTDAEAIYVGKYNYVDTPKITGVVVEYNTLIDCGYTGEGDIDIKPACSAAIVRYNKHYRTAYTSGHGKSCGVVIACNGEVYGNEFYNEGRADGDWGFGIYANADGNGTTGIAINNLKIYNNLIYNCQGSGIKVSATTSGYNMSGVRIDNNTIVGNASYGIRIVASGATITVASMCNNIVDSNTTNNIILTSGVTMSLVNNNAYYGPVDSLWSVSASNKTWSQWQALGYDTNGINAKTTMGTDYKLSVGSNAIGAGKDLSTYFTIDKDRNTRSAWDIGAYRYAPMGFNALIRIVR